MSSSTTTFWSRRACDEHGLGFHDPLLDVWTRRLRLDHGDDLGDAEISLVDTLSTRTSVSCEDVGSDVEELSDIDGDRPPQRPPLKVQQDLPLQVRRQISQQHRVQAHHGLIDRRDEVISKKVDYLRTVREAWLERRRRLSSEAELDLAGACM